jgi:hypothetical protein
MGADPATEVDGPCPTAMAFADGAATSRVCIEDAAGLGFTLLDLADDWTPRVLAGIDGAPVPAYRATYRALAADNFAAAGADGAIARGDRYLELFGIVPSLTVVAARLGDEARHACHERVDDLALLDLDEVLREESPDRAQARQRRAVSLRAALERDTRRAGMPDLEALAARDGGSSRRVAELERLEHRRDAVLAMQAHLACDGLLPDRHVDGLFTWRTGQALAAYQRRHVLVPGAALDDETQRALAADSRDLDLDAALRVLRARVVDATGLIEDGSAREGSRPVLGRLLDSEHATQVAGHEPLPGGADDLVGAAVEQAALALGWTDAANARAFLAARASGAVPDRVAVRLPPLPAYHSSRMDLAVEIDRGDVWYDRVPRRRPIDRRPALILYALRGSDRIPLVRWPTTIGGWQDEKLACGTVVPRWKESEVGARVWRDLYLAPTWLPPPTTPDDELVRATGGGRYELRREAIGPGYRAAYGLVMLVHHVADTRRGRVVLRDRGIRTHGTGNVTSVFDGRSHGCHRLLGVQALRLAGFLVRHRDHQWHGPEQTWYRRVVRAHGTFRITVTGRGDRIELVPPLRVDVLPGTIRPAGSCPPSQPCRRP